MLRPSLPGRNEMPHASLVAKLRVRPARLGRLAQVRQKSQMRARKRTATQYQRRDRPRGGVISDPHVTAARGFFDGHLRNNRDTHARANHAEQAAELSTLKNNLRVQPGAVAR